MAAEDWPEEEEGWSVEGTGALEVGRGLVAVETSEDTALWPDLDRLRNFLGCACAR